MLPVHRPRTNSKVRGTSGHLLAPTRWGSSFHGDSYRHLREVHPLPRPVWLWHGSLVSSQVRTEGCFTSFWPPRFRGIPLVTSERELVPSLPPTPPTFQFWPPAPSPGSVLAWPVNSWEPFPPAPSNQGLRDMHRCDEATDKAETQDAPGGAHFLPPEPGLAKAPPFPGGTGTSSTKCFPRAQNSTWVHPRSHPIREQIPGAPRLAQKTGMANQEVENARNADRGPWGSAPDQARAPSWEAVTVFCTKETSAPDLHIPGCSRPFSMWRPTRKRHFLPKFPQRERTGLALSSPQAVWRPHSEHSTSCPLQAVQAKRVAPRPTCKDRTRASGDSAWCTALTWGSVTAPRASPSEPLHHLLPWGLPALLSDFNTRDGAQGRVTVAWSPGHKCRCS